VVWLFLEFSRLSLKAGRGFNLNVSPSKNVVAGPLDRELELDVSLGALITHTPAGH